MPLLNETAVTMHYRQVLEVLRDVTEQLIHPDSPEFDDPDICVQGFSTDTRTIEPGNCFIALTGANFDGNLYAKQAAEKGAILCILSRVPEELPDIPCLITKDTVAAYGLLANAYRMACVQEGDLSRVIAVTGSSGKTTVKDMTAHVLSHRFRTYATAGNHNNHIGVPYTLLHMPLETEIAILEMGMNHSGEIHRLTNIGRPDIALITNIGTAHIGNLGSQEAIFRAKLEVLDGMDESFGKLILPSEDAYLANAKEIPFNQKNIRYTTITGKYQAELSAEEICELPDRTEFTVRNDSTSVQVVLPMTGLHNVSNALLAMQAGLECGMTLRECADALADFRPGAMRSERAYFGNLTVVQDYYNANPEAMTASLHALGTIAAGAKTVAVLGNMNELGDYAADAHRTLGAYCKEHLDACWFCGVNHADFAEGLGKDAHVFSEQEALIASLTEALPSLTAEPCCMLIKASRGMHMERVFEAVKKAMQEKGAADV